MFRPTIVLFHIVSSSLPCPGVRARVGWEVQRWYTGWLTGMLMKAEDEEIDRKRKRDIWQARMKKRTAGGMEERVLTEEERIE